MYFFFFLILINLLIFYKFFIISSKIGFFDKPDLKRKIHKTPIANIGGMIFFVSILLFIFYCVFNDKENFNFLFKLAPYFIIFIIIGLVDDKINLNPNLKLLLFSVVIFFLILNNEIFLIKDLKFIIFEKEIGLSFLSYIFTIIAFLAFINSMNMFDGINLQSSFYMAFLCIVFISKNFLSELFIIILIPLFFFSLLNYKNRCFLGNNGTYSLSFLFSCIFIFSYNEGVIFYPEEILLIMILPGIEMIRLTIMRLAKGRHPFKGDKNHLHHYLLKKYGNSKAVIISTILSTSPYLSLIFFKDYILYVIIFSIFGYFSIIKMLERNFK